MFVVRNAASRASAAFSFSINSSRWAVAAFCASSALLCRNTSPTASPMHRTIRRMTGAFEFICGAYSAASLAGASLLRPPELRGPSDPRPPRARLAIRVLCRNTRRMTAADVQRALADITAETDPTLKHLKLASLVSAVFRERGVELVVVGGSAIEFYTEGAYVSGDLDLCVDSSCTALTVRLRQEIMAQLRATGGPRSWQVGGLYVDVLGDFENLARTPIRRLDGPCGEVRISPVEELLVERVLISKYPGDYPPARECATKLMAAALLGEIETDWAEVKRLAEDTAYKNWNDVKELVHEQAEALQVRSPYHSDE